MNIFFKDIRNYKHYAAYSAVASLKADVSASYFNWLWWILDPFLFMLVYSFVSVVVFGKTEPHLIPFIFIGYSAWSFFNHNITQSVKLVRGNKSILSRVYLPKYILLTSMIIENLIKYLISVGLCLIVAILDHVEFSFCVLWFPFLIIGLMLLSFGICTILLHLGVYVKDLSNVITVAMKLIFYLSGVFYNVGKRVPDPYGKILLYFNPIAMYMNEMRNVVLYKTAPSFILILAWIVVSILLSCFGIRLIQKHEQNYVKAI